MRLRLTKTEYIICENQGSLFNFIASRYTYDSFLSFVPAFLCSDFCRQEWDSSYSYFQFDDVKENLDFILPELANKIYLNIANDNDTVFDRNAAGWIGFTYRQIQILTAISSRDLSRIIPFNSLCAAYPGLHTIDPVNAAASIIEAYKLIQPSRQLPVAEAAGSPGVRPH